MRINCSKCGDPVSNEVPDGTIVRAWVECPDCCIVRDDSALRVLAREVVESRASDYMHVSVDEDALNRLAKAVR